jgi:catabolite regulation protein CreA
MKNSYVIALLVSASLLLASCGSNVKTSPEMTDFMSMMKGNFKDVKAAIGKYGSTPEMVDNDITMYDLSEPKVTGVEGDCYNLEAKAGITVRMYKICWSAGKISSIEDKGMK